MYALRMREDDRSRLWRHLLPADDVREQAAFLFCSEMRGKSGTVFEISALELLSPKDFATQHEDYIELADETRVRIIKCAHAANMSLAEVHSHPGPLPAAFSWSDRTGLQETVPHMRWRLPGRAYLALVVAPSGFDALVWPDGSDAPQPLSRIESGSRRLIPTNASLKGWSHE